MKNVNNIPGGWTVGDWCKFSDPEIKGLFESRKTGKIVGYNADTNILKISCDGKIYEQQHTDQFGGISGVHKDDKEYYKTQEKSKLPHSLDARDWAKEFCETIQMNSSIPYDEETMMGWFANAIMAGWDEMSRRKSKEDENRWIYVLTNSQTGETVALYSEEPTKEKCDRDYSLHLGQDLEWSVRNVLYTAGQDSAWNCNLHRMKVDSLNRMKEVVEIKDLKQYEK